MNPSKKLMKATAIASLMLCAFVFLFFPEISSAQSSSWTIGGAIERILWTFVNVFFGWLVYVGGIVLNIGVNTYVVGFGAQYESTGLGFAIDSLWVIVRDIFNLTFIFGLVLIGLKMIFNADDAGNKKMLVMLIMAALLVNFSLFITKFVVDFANIAAYQLVEAFPKVEGKADISSSFMELMGLKGLLNFGTSAGFNFSDMNNGAGLGYIFGTLLLYLIAAFVFLGGGLLLMIRFVVLNLYMVLSPLMFLGWVFPAASSVTSEYWKGFLGRAFFAPAYILMLYLSYNILSSFSGTAGGKTLSSIFVPTGRDTFESVVPPFILTSIFLIASIVIAQKMGANGGSAVLAAGKSLSNKVRNTSKNIATKGVNATTYLPRLGARALTNYAGEKADKGLTRMQARGGVLGTAAKWNFVDRAARGATQAASKAQYGTGQTNESERDYSAKTQSRINQTVAEDQRAADLKASEVAIGAINNSSIATATSSAALKKALDNLGKQIRDMSKDEKADLGLSKLTDKNYAVHLTDSDIENLDKSGKFGAQDIKSIKDARNEAFKSIASHGTTHTTGVGAARIYANASAGSTFRTPAGVNIHTSATGMDQRGDIPKKGAREVGKLPVEVFMQKEMYAHLTPAMLEERIKNGMKESERMAIRQALADHLGFYTLPGGTPPTPISGGAPTTNLWHKWESNPNSNLAAQFFA